MQAVLTVLTTGLNAGASIYMPLQPVPRMTVGPDIRILYTVFGTGLPLGAITTAGVSTEYASPQGDWWNEIVTGPDRSLAVDGCSET